MKSKMRMVIVKVRGMLRRSVEGRNYELVEGVLAAGNRSEDTVSVAASLLIVLQLV